MLASNLSEVLGRATAADLDLVLHDIATLCGEHLTQVSATMEGILSPALDPADAQRRVRALRVLHEVAADLANELVRLLRSTAALDVSLEAKDALKGYLLFFDIQRHRISARLRPRLMAVPSEAAGETPPTGLAQARS